MPRIAVAIAQRAPARVAPVALRSLPVGARRTALGAGSRRWLPVAREPFGVPLRQMGKMRWIVAGSASLALLVSLAGCGSSTAGGSARANALASSTTASTMRVATQLVSYDAVQVLVPRSWPVVDGMHTGFCGGPFDATPTAYTGPNENGAPSCPVIDQEAQRRYDGVWLQPESRPPGLRLVRGRGPAALFRVFDWHDPNTRDYWINGVDIRVGVGRDGRIAAGIVSSIRYAPGAQNTSAQGVCARQPHPDRMPKPERLAATLVIEHGNLTLAPPRPTDHPVESAAQAWRDDAAKYDYEHYRLILARYSEKLPARVTPHGLVPIEHDVLAWVVYETPISAKIQGCGGWGVNADNATTGHGITSSGWAPGP